MTRTPSVVLTGLFALVIACGDDSTSGSGSGAGAGTGGGSSNTGGNSNTGASNSGTGASTATGNEMCANGPLAAPIPGCAPVAPASTGDLHQDCVDRINQFRWECQCLPPLARWTDGEACTDQQSADDQASDSPHGNFGACGENAQNTCPNWPSEGDVVGGCLQMMWDEGPGDFNSHHGHYINMSSTEYSKVACGFSTAAGGVWSNQNFAP